MTASFPSPEQSILQQRKVAAADIGTHQAKWGKFPDIEYNFTNKVY